MTSVAEKKQIICDFLKRANIYSEHKLDEYEAQLNRVGTTNVLSLVEKIDQWESYKAFNEYAVGELQTDRLDDWFTDS